VENINPKDLIFPRYLDLKIAQEQVLNISAHPASFGAILHKALTEFRVGRQDDLIWGVIKCQLTSISNGN
jgi:hypothetical protein